MITRRGFIAGLLPAIVRPSSIMRVRCWDVASGRVAWNGDFIEMMRYEMASALQIPVKYLFVPHLWDGVRLPIVPHVDGRMVRPEDTSMVDEKGLQEGRSGPAGSNADQTGFMGAASEQPPTVETMGVDDAFAHAVKTLLKTGDERDKMAAGVLASVGGVDAAALTDD